MSERPVVAVVDVDVAPVDRLMPDTSGDAVVAASTERGWGGAVAVVTAVEPDFDVLEPGFGDYAAKPVHRDVLEGTVERLFERSTYDEQVRELFALAAKRAALEPRRSGAELDESREYRRLSAAIVELGSRVDETALALNDSGFELALRGTE